MYLKNYRWEIDGDLILISINLDTIYTDSFPGFVTDDIYYGSGIKWFLFSMGAPYWTGTIIFCSRNTEIKFIITDCSTWKSNLNHHLIWCNLHYFYSAPFYEYIQSMSTHETSKESLLQIRYNRRASHNHSLISKDLKFQFS